MKRVLMTFFPVFLFASIACGQVKQENIAGNIELIPLKNSKIELKDMLHNFLGQSESLYVVTQLANDPSSLIDKIKQCRVKPSSKEDCFLFLSHLARSVSAYKTLTMNDINCNSICKLYTNIDNHLSVPVKELEHLVVVFSTQ